MLPQPFDLSDDEYTTLYPLYSDSDMEATFKFRPVYSPGNNNNLLQCKSPSNRRNQNYYRNMKKRRNRQKKHNNNRRVNGVDSPRSFSISPQNPSPNLLSPNIFCFGRRLQSMQQSNNRTRLTTHTGESSADERENSATPNIVTRKRHTNINTQRTNAIHSNNARFLKLHQKIQSSYLQTLKKNRKKRKFKSMAVPMITSPNINHLSSSAATNTCNQRLQQQGMKSKQKKRRMRKRRTRTFYSYKWGNQLFNISPDNLLCTVEDDGGRFNDRGEQIHNNNNTERINTKYDERTSALSRTMAENILRWTKDLNEIAGRYDSNEDGLDLCEKSPSISAGAALYMSDIDAQCCQQIQSPKLLKKPVISFNETLSDMDGDAASVASEVASRSKFKIIVSSVNDHNNNNNMEEEDIDAKRDQIIDRMMNMDGDTTDDCCDDHCDDHHKYGVFLGGNDLNIGVFSSFDSETESESRLYDTADGNDDDIEDDMRTVRYYPQPDFTSFIPNY